MDAISVVIPAHNAATTLPRTLACLVLQLGHQDEVVVVDDHSSDRTAAIAARLADPRVTVVTHDGRTGPGAARNAGAGRTHHDLLAFIDADDEPAAGWLDAMRSALGSASVATGALDPHTLNPSASVLARGLPPAHEDTLGRLGPVPLLRSGNLAIRRATFEGVGGFDESLPTAEDLDLSLRLHLTGEQLRWVPDAVVRYRLRSGTRALWSQGVAYGIGQVRFAKGVSAATEWTAPRVDLIAWRRALAASARSVRSQEHRGRATWLVGVRWGRIRGSVTSRWLHV